MVRDLGLPHALEGGPGPEPVPVKGPEVLEAGDELGEGLGPRLVLALLIDLVAHERGHVVPEDAVRERGSDHVGCTGKRRRRLALRKGLERARDGLEPGPPPARGPLPPPPHQTFAFLSRCPGTHNSSFSELGKSPGKREAVDKKPKKLKKV